MNETIFDLGRHKTSENLIKTIDFTISVTDAEHRCDHYASGVKISRRASGLVQLRVIVQYSKIPSAKTVFMDDTT